MRVKRATEADFDEEKHQIKKWLQIQKLRKENSEQKWMKKSLWKEENMNGWGRQDRDNWKRKLDKPRR